MTTPNTAPQPYFRTPVLAPAGDQIAFVYASDIWLVGAHGGRAERLTAHPSTNHTPRWSPDGTQLAFASNRTGAGDMYLLAVDGGDVRRLTYHDVPSTPEAWSADGAHLFFGSRRGAQGTAIYRVPAAGGTPVQWLAQPYEVLDNLSIAPDGTQLAFNVSRDPWWRRGPNHFGGSELWCVGSALGATDFRKLSQHTGANRWPLWMPDGSSVYVVSDQSGVENIWLLPLDGGPARQITYFEDGRVLWPSLSGDGRTLVFERAFGIWRMDTATGEAAPLPVQVRPDSKVTPVRVQRYAREFNELSVSPDGKKLAFVVRGDVFVDFADKDTDKERRQGPAFPVTNTHARESDVCWSPDSRKLVYVSDRNGEGDIYMYDVAARREEQLISSARPNSAPCFSPDGTWLAYVRGDDEIRLLHMDTREDRSFISASCTFQISFAWSPDSQWIVFVSQDERLFSNLYAQRVGETTPRQITFLSNLYVRQPRWAANGTFLVFTTGQYRAESQLARLDLLPPEPIFRETEFEKLFGEPPASPPSGDKADEPAVPEASAPKATPAKVTVTIEFDGIVRRLRFLTPTQMNASVQAISPDSRDLVFSAAVMGKPDLWTMPLDEPRRDQAQRQLTTHPGTKGAVQFAPDGKTFFYIDGGQIAQRKFPKGDQITLPVGADVTIRFTAEKQQMFAECWRLMRDHFYDPTFRGLDWNAVRDTFAPLVAGAQTASDFYALLNLMVGELRASHLGVYGGGAAQQDGYTGLLFDQTELAEHGRLRISAIIPDTPAALAGNRINIGEYLLAVNNTPIAPHASLDELLQRAVGRRVTLRIGAALDGPTRDVAVRPIGMEQYDHLCYQAWTLANEAYVHQQSGGRLGYVHIRAMSYEAYQQFLADLDVETYSKEGIVLDVRFNGGGHISSFILDVLARRSVLRSGYRNRLSVDAEHFHGNRVLSKPTVLVINERSFSNTESFAEGYRRLNLGSLVGRPTGGAVISTIDWRLLDGAMFRVPRFKIATLEGEDLEGQGRPPDVDVALPLGAPARGEDPQLDAAIRTLLGQIDGG